MRGEAVSSDVLGSGGPVKLSIRTSVMKRTGAVCHQCQNLIGPSMSLGQNRYGGVRSSVGVRVSLIHDTILIS